MICFIDAVEYGENKTYSCYSETPIGDYALIDGDGNTVAEAKADFLGRWKNAVRLILNWLLC